MAAVACWTLEIIIFGNWYIWLLIAEFPVSVWISLTESRLPCPPQKYRKSKRLGFWWSIWFENFWGIAAWVPTIEFIGTSSKIHSHCISYSGPEDTCFLSFISHLQEQQVYICFSEPGDESTQHILLQQPFFTWCLWLFLLVGLVIHFVLSWNSIN